ncbi:hypothetical protein EYF80_014778 [Liparis tanakae]|uniref:Uncharacterized protein n=1 Tax=Liparis tanakae TaxID=230148 RepID=A0A4Z2IC90_9TELE|nr:hypothetical protein EYF80_014778 [Liparis tanakae]
MWPSEYRPSLTFSTPSNSYSQPTCCTEDNGWELSPHSPASLSADIRWNSGSWSHFHILLNVSRPDLSLLHGLGFRSRSDRVPWDRHKIL